MIIKTLIRAQNDGKAKNTVISISHSLRQLSQHADLRCPAEVKAYVATASVCNATKTKLCFGCDWFCKTNGIQWTKPKYRWERKIRARHLWTPNALYQNQRARAAMRNLTSDRHFVQDRDD